MRSGSRLMMAMLVTEVSFLVKLLWNRQLSLQSAVLRRARPPLLDAVILGTGDVAGSKWSRSRGDASSRLELFCLASHSL